MKDADSMTQADSTGSATPQAAPRADSGAYDSDVAERALAALAGDRLDPTDKGFAGVDPDAVLTAVDLEGSPVTGARGLGTRESVLSTPLLVLHDDAIDHNVKTMAAYCAHHGALLAPHAKTTMSPELFVRQLQAGAWALTAANVTQAAVFARFGARRVLIANQVTDPVAIEALALLLNRTAGLSVACYVDSRESVALLDETLRSASVELGHRLPVLVERGLPDGRTGVRDTETGLAVARAAAATQTLSVVGVSCFEGGVGHGTDDATLEAARSILRSVRELGEAIVAEGTLGGGFGTPEHEPSLILSAGGSHYFDLVTAEFAGPEVRTVIRSGSYVAHDHGTYLRSSPSLRDSGLPAFQPAIEIKASVLSRPQPELVLINAGRRDVSFDSGWPIPLAARRGDRDIEVSGVSVTDLNDQHGYLRVPADSELAVGDVVSLGISHPCTTFDKWRLGVLVDADDTVVGVAHTFF
jgi:D-serine deaminase-like pyridoxal phosphate-dependent protein